MTYQISDKDYELLKFHIGENHKQYSTIGLLACVQIIDDLVKIEDIRPARTNYSEKIAEGARFHRGDIITFEDAQMSFVVDYSEFDEEEEQIVYWCHDMYKVNYPPDGYITDSSAYRSHFDPNYYTQNKD